MPAKKHVHKYYKVELNGHFVWACALPDCSHYIPKHLELMMSKGKKSICWSCRQEFILNALSMQLNQPTCDECNPQASNLMNAIDKLGI